jgi:uncharacterized protein
VTVCPDVLFHMLLQTPMGRIFTISSFEYTLPSGHYISELHQDKATGQLSALSTRPVDWSKWGGIITPCAGSQSPWGSHMAGEEVCPDGKCVCGRVGARDLPRGTLRSWTVWLMLT